MSCLECLLVLLPRDCEAALQARYITVWGAPKGVTPHFGAPQQKEAEPLLNLLLNLDSNANPVQRISLYRIGLELLARSGGN